MLDVIIDMFSYTFMLRALIVGLLVTVCSSLLGTSLVLKGYSMIGDGLSHVAFGALTIATVLGFSPLKFTIPIVIIAAFFILKLNKKSSLKGDAAIGMISVTSLAIGVLVVSLGTGLNTDLYSYLFGSILSMNAEDVILSIVLSLVVIILFIFSYNKIFAVTFDEDFAISSGTNCGFYNMLIAILTAVTVVLGMKMMGTLIISALIIFPAITSITICKSFKKVVICSLVLSIICFCTGLIISYMYNLPTGATIVTINAITYIILWIFKKQKK